MEVIFAVAEKTVAHQSKTFSVIGITDLILHKAAINEVCFCEAG